MTDNKSTLSHSLRILRIKSKLSQRDLSDKSGVKQATISEIEKGKANPTLETLISLAKSLDAEIRIDLR